MQNTRIKLPPTQDQIKLGTYYENLARQQRQEIDNAYAMVNETENNDKTAAQNSSSIFLKLADTNFTNYLNASNLVASSITASTTF